MSVEYVPGESVSRLFGGNSNWRGPKWFPVNYLLLELLQRFHDSNGDSGRGVGAFHQTDWTGLIAETLEV